MLVIDTDNNFKNDGKLVEEFMARLRGFLSVEGKDLVDDKEAQEI